MVRFISAALMAPCLVAAVACSGSRGSGPAKAPAARAAAGVILPGAPGVPWSRKSHAQRAEFMGLVVFPKMKALFQAHDATGYAQFRCQTCHGEDMEARDFRMPNSLYALPAADPVKAALEYDEKTARFMLETVVPAMKELFARDDPAFAASFGCLDCHQKEQ